MRILTQISITLSLIIPAALAADYGNLSMSFEPNVGQAPASTRYVARGASYSVLLEDGGPVLTVQSSAKRPAQTLSIVFPGAAVGRAAIAEERLAGITNYFLGKDRSNWHSQVPTYRTVRYPNRYPGIDIVYYGHQGRLEYDFKVAAGADPSRIRMRFSGAGRARVSPEGDLVFANGGENLRQHKPVAYQERNGRTPVEVSYRVLASGDVALDIGHYDAGVALVIDPTLSYASYFGGTGSDAISSVKVDATGALYVTGYTNSGTFKTTAGVVQTGFKGQTNTSAFFGFGDAFVAKFSPSGTLVYSTYLGGRSDDVATALAIDAAGNAYVAGDTQSTDFPVTSGSYQTRFAGASPDEFFSRGDVFVVKLSADGSQIIYGTYLGGSMNDGAWGIAVDSTGIATVVGDTISTDFPTTANAISRTFRGAANSAISPLGDAFIARLSADGKSLLYSSYVGGRSHDMARAVAVDAQGNAYVCGLTYSSDFPVTAGALQTTFRGVETTDYDAAADDAWIMKLSAQGTVVYSTYLGGSYRDGAFGIAVDAAGSAYVTGRTMSTNFPVTSNALQKTYGGSGGAGNASDWTQGDAFVAKLNPAGSALVYSTYLGGRGDDAGGDIQVDASGNAYITGFTLSSDFPVSGDALQKVFAGYGGQGFNTGGPPPEGVANTGDAFVMKLDPQGAMLYSSYFGGSGDDAAGSIAVDGGGNVYIGGSTVSPSLPTTAAVQPSYGGAGSYSPHGDGFIARFDFGGKIPPVPARIAFQTGPASGTAGTALSSALSVLVGDAQGNPMAGIAVTFSATNASVSPATATTNASGIATVNVTLGSAGTAQVSAAVVGLAPATFAITVNPAVAGPVILAVKNAASFTTKIAPGGYIAIGGTALAAARADAATVPLPPDLGGVKVRVNGTQVPLLVVTDTLVNAILPYETPLGNAVVTVESNGVVSAPFPFTVIAAAPGIFLYNGTRAVAQNVAADGTLPLNTVDNPVQPTKGMVVYVTGQGALDHSVVSGGMALADPLSKPVGACTATVGGLPAPVDFCGMTPSLISVLQVNLRIPDGLLANDYPVIVTVGGTDSNAALIAVKP